MKEKKKKGKYITTDRLYGYFPSFTAQVLDIATKKRPRQKVFSGFEIRPMIRR